MGEVGAGTQPLQSEEHWPVVSSFHISQWSALAFESQQKKSWSCKIQQGRLTALR